MVVHKGGGDVSSDLREQVRGLEASVAAAEAAEKIHKDTKMMLERAESQADYHSTAATAARDVSSPSPYDWLFHRIRNWL